MSENKRFKPKKASVKRLAIAFILIVAVAAGIYTILTKADDQATEKENIRVHNEEKQEKPKPTSEKQKEPEKGTVTNETPKKDKDDGVTSEEGTTNKNETDVVMPTINKDAIIANAKTQVYTVYTDLQQGSGFLINSSGDILTNAHVAKNAGYVVVKNQHGQEFQGKVIGISKKTDVALIRVPDLAGKNPLVLDATTAKVGTKVVAIGSPKDQYGTTTEGIVKSVGAEFFDDYTYSHLYEITARLSRGSSGGPLINAESGNVIGINSIILEDHPEIGYAIPLSAVMGLVNDWVANAPKVSFEEENEEDYNHADDAYFDEELLSENMKSFYVLVIESLTDGKHNYYDAYISPKSEALKTARAFIGNYNSDGKKFKSLQYNVTGVTIGDKSSNVTMSTITTYTDRNNKKQTIKENITFKIIIDDIGEYMIQTITVNSSVDSGKVKPPVEKPPVDPNTGNKPDEGTNTDTDTDSNEGSSDPNGTEKPKDEGESEDLDTDSVETPKTPPVEEPETQEPVVPQP